MMMTAAVLIGLRKSRSSFPHCRVRVTSVMICRYWARAAKELLMWFESLEGRTLLSAAPTFPVDQLPWNIQKIADGSRAAWSPNGHDIAFVDKQFGNAYEYDVMTRTTREITNLIKNPHILRV